MCAGSDIVLLHAQSGTFTWELLSSPVPPPEDLGQGIGIYLGAAWHLRRVAKACSQFMRNAHARDVLGTQVSFSRRSEHAVNDVKEDRAGERAALEIESNVKAGIVPPLRTD